MRRTTPRSLADAPARPLMLCAVVAAVGALAACGNSGVSPAPPPAAEAAPPEAAPVAAFELLTGQSTTITLDEGFSQAVAEAGVEIGGVGDARVGDGKVRLPITGGEVQYFDPAGEVQPFLQGRIEHAASGVRLTAAGRAVELAGLELDAGTGGLAATASVDGGEPTSLAPLLTLDPGTLQPLRTVPDGRAVLEGATVNLSPEAAEVLNGALGTTALAPGAIGVAKLTLAGEAPPAEG
jgi:hypothetical protein